MSTVHLIISGKVQGVFYRATAKEVAGKMGVTGKVQNKEGGDVEIWASGTDEQLQQFIAWCGKGPSGARVEEVKTVWVADQEFDAFNIIRK